MSSPLSSKIERCTLTCGKIHVLCTNDNNQKEEEFEFLGMKALTKLHYCKVIKCLFQRSKLRPFWSPWRVEKYLATKILAKVANWRPTDLKRNLLEKLSKIGRI